MEEPVKNERVYVVAPTHQMYRVWFNEQEARPNSLYIQTEHDLRGRRGKVIILNGGPNDIQMLKYIEYLESVGLITTERAHV